MKPYGLILCLLAAAGTVLGVDSSLTRIDALVVSPRPASYEFMGDGSVALSVCYNWSCARVRRLRITADELAEVVAYMDKCSGNGLHDRLQRLRIGIWRMELLAQRYIPALGNDLAVNDRDFAVEGRTDCVDNASNTTTFLAVLADLGALPGWIPGDPQVRDRFNNAVHWTATISDTRGGERWAVDSWFRPHGHLPFVTPLPDWEAARKGWEPPLDRLNPYPKYFDHLCRPPAPGAGVSGAGAG